MAFEERCSVGSLPFSEEVALCGADDVHGVGDARHGVFTGAEDGHQLVAEEVGFEALLDGDELGVEVLVTLPYVVGVAEAKRT